MTWERYTGANPTGLEIELYLGDTWTPRSYCDDPDIGPVGIYIAKAPVCKLKLTPVVQFINTNIAWDISQSGSATSTIDTFDIDWGGATDIGDLTAQDWSSDPKSGNVQYTGTGRFTVTASVTDLLGTKSKEAKITVNIVGTEGCYIGVTGTTNEGFYILASDGTPSVSTTGLTGNHKNFRSVRLHPYFAGLAATQHHLWAATQDGAAYTTDGGQNWTVISEATLGTPTNDAGDSPAPAAADPDNIDVAFDPTDPRIVYLMRRITSPNNRVWLYKTVDYGATWTNTQVGV